MEGRGRPHGTPVGASLIRGRFLTTQHLYRAGVYGCVYRATHRLLWHGPRCLFSHRHWESVSRQLRSATGLPLQLHPEVWKGRQWGKAEAGSEAAKLVSAALLTARAAAHKHSPANIEHRT